MKKHRGNIGEEPPRYLGPRSSSEINNRNDCTTEIQTKITMANDVLMDDETHFWLNGYVDKQNCRNWSEANPQVYVETPLHPEKLTVWCALWAGGILLQKRRRPQRYSQW
ncbi:hypothetical protein TNCV_2979061 [Trichonephila clavipes]|nr:hypothetical protein TNCV_2979061 [Trichonephila clavipes]